MKKYICILAFFFTISASQALASWVTDPSVIEPTYYADHNRDLYDEFGYNTQKLLNHWVKFGIRDGRPSSPVFDVRYYLKRNPDLATTLGRENFAKATEHWFKNGRKEGRPSHPEFNVRKYLQLNQDVAREYGQNNYLEAINHYLKTGYKKGRRGI
ncbi:MAG: hypothetical protein HKP52_09975 [Desulfofustis sp.]|nr:hypothetical protein [Desulfofustis sp.]